jgi:hypothetical protein
VSFAKEEGVDMQVMCGRCDKAMIAGVVTPTGLDDHVERGLTFTVSAGSPTSLNPVKAVLQGMRGEPDYREQTCPVRARVCPSCGRLEFCLDPEDLRRVTDIALARGAE